jgi:hypothetical protein
MPVVLVITLIGILALLFNSGVLVLIVREKKIRKNPYHFLVFMLCVSDFVVGVGIVFAIFRHFIPALQVSEGVIILHSLLMTVGIYFSLYNTFLISIQRFLVIYKEKWSYCLFGQNRKYFVCVGGWITIVITNCALISPPAKEIESLDDINILSFVYYGHYMAYKIYIRSVTLFLLSATVILYLVTIVYVNRSYRKVNPNVNSITLPAVRVIQVQPTAPGPSSYTGALPSVEGQGRPNVQLAMIKRKKVISTLQLVGLLITVFLLFSGPLVITLSWFDTFSSRIRGILFTLFGINSALNPFIYVWKLVDIREMVKKTLCCCKR